MGRCEIDDGGYLAHHNIRSGHHDIRPGHDQRDELIGYAVDPVSAGLDGERHHRGGSGKKAHPRQDRIARRRRLRSAGTARDRRRDKHSVTGQLDPPAIAARVGDPGGVAGLEPSRGLFPVLRVVANDQLVASLNLHAGEALGREHIVNNCVARLLPGLDFPVDAIPQNSPAVEPHPTFQPSISSRK